MEDRGIRRRPIVCAEAGTSAEAWDFLKKTTNDLQTKDMHENFWFRQSEKIMQTNLLSLVSELFLFSDSEHGKVGIQEFFRSVYSIVQEFETHLVGRECQIMVFYHFFKDYGNYSSEPIMRNRVFVLAIPSEKFREGLESGEVRVPEGEHMGSGKVTLDLNYCENAEDAIQCYHVGRTLVS